MLGCILSPPFYSAICSWGNVRQETTGFWRHPIFQTNPNDEFGIICGIIIFWGFLIISVTCHTCPSKKWSNMPQFPFIAEAAAVSKVLLRQGWHATNQALCGQLRCPRPRARGCTGNQWKVRMRLAKFKIFLVVSDSNHRKCTSVQGAWNINDMENMVNTGKRL